MKASGRIAKNAMIILMDRMPYMGMPNSGMNATRQKVDKHGPEKYANKR